MAEAYILLDCLASGRGVVKNTRGVVSRMNCSNL